jgi:hypothetical protein
MPARYGKFGTGIENWRPNADKTVWIHKNNSEMKVFIRPNTYVNSKDKYQIYHTEYNGRSAVSASYEYANTMVEARKIARKRLTQWNNPLYW